MKKSNYYLIDASKQPLGRIATKVAVLLRGKSNPNFRPNVLSNNVVIVINAAAVRLSGSKSLSKIYTRYTGFPGGIKTQTFSTLRKSNPAAILRHAVRGMLPKNRLTSAWLSNLKIITDNNHPYNKGEKIIEIEE